VRDERVDVEAGFGLGRLREHAISDFCRQGHGRREWGLRNRAVKPSRLDYPAGSIIDPRDPTPPVPPSGDALLQPVAGQPQQRRFRTHWNSDWVVFQIVFGVGAIAVGFYRWPLSVLFGAFFAYATWIWSRRTTVDRARPLEHLRVVRRVKKSKGTTTITYDILSGGRTIADGLPAKTAALLANELCDFFGVPRVAVPE